MTFKPIIILFCLLFAKILSGQESISGIVNQYVAVEEVDYLNQSLLVLSSADFSVCDKILLIQMQGAEIQLTNDADFGEILDYGSAGNFEFNKILSILGNRLFLESPILRTYDVTDKVQIVSIPVYNAVAVDDVLTCQAWDGQTGGVLALECNNELQLNAAINVSEKGFRSFDSPQGTDPCSSYDFFYPANSPLGAPKGESIWVTDSNFSSGRGAAANGGGGGNLHNSGGGGGAHAGAGGIGGFEWSSCAANGDPNNGCGGRAIDADFLDDRIFMGGAGGTGHENNQVGSNGGFGGGIIIIKTKKLTGNGKSLLAKGGNAASTLNDAGGGGGAGGTIILSTQIVNGDLHVNARGGKGGDVDFVECHGTGGGGGGGLLWHSFSNLPANIDVFLPGGKAGIGISSQANCYNETYGAANGETGLLINDLPDLPGQVLEADFVLSAEPDPFFCFGESGQLKVTPLPDSISYWTGPSGFESTEPFPTLFDIDEHQTGWYVFSEKYNACSFYQDSILISMLASPYVDLGPDTSLCQGEALQLIAGDSTNTYLWSNEFTDPVISVKESGTYSVVVYNGCENAFDQITIYFQDDCLDQCPLYSPNALSANGDGINDLFQQVSPCAVEDYQLVIYNRWGEKIFETRNWNTGWDGQRGNRYAQKGAYVWVVKAILIDDFGLRHEVRETGMVMVL